MKKLALFLALCLLMQAVGLTALAETGAKVPDEQLLDEALKVDENASEEPPAEGLEIEDKVADNGVKDNGDSGNFVLDSNNYICEYNGTMTAIVLPTKVGGKTVKGITETAFSGNTTIQSIVIPATGYNNIANGVFRNCTGLESVSIYNPIKSIVAEAFMGCTNLRAISWPSGLLTIEHDAFNGCTSLKAVGMTTNLVTIEDNAFKNCSALMDFDMEDSTALTTIGSSAFYGCSSMKAIILPANATNISNSAFENCKAATKLKLPNGLKRIESFTFRNCSSLKNITLPNNLNYIGQEAFKNCSALDYVIFPTGNKLKNILKNAFDGITANTVLFMRGNFTKLKISKNGLGTAGIIVGKKNKLPHEYVKTHSGMKFLTLQGEEYIARVYQHLLSRAVTFSENLTQIRNLALGKFSAATLVRAIANGTECAKKKWNNTQFIRKLYRIMLARTSNPPDSEIETWKKCLSIGMTRDGIINAIATSDEHKANCKKWLLTPGSVINSNYRDRNYQYTLFVHKAYRYALYGGVSKKVTIQNLEVGCKNLIDDKWTAYKFLHSLVKSKAFVDLKKNNEEFVTILYRIYLGYKPANADRDYWVNKIKVDRKTRDWVEEKIAESREFINKMKKIGLKSK